MSSRSYLLNEFSNPKRLDILQMLAEGPSSFTTISKNLKISSSEVSRHLTRLIDQGFIQKSQSTREFKLSVLGEIVNCLMSPLDFVFNLADYFREHDIMALPVSIIRDIDTLDCFEFITGTGFVMLKLPEIVESAENKIKVMTSQPFPWGKKGLDVKYIVPFELVKFRKDVEGVNRSTDARLFQHVGVSMIISDSGEGMVFFPGLDGNTDYDKGFYCKRGNSEGFSYLNRIWDYFWSTGEIQQ
ncbi:MAG: ArsR family transcriptional regulator [Candidatus Hodarchaeales archaeon]